MSEAEDSPEFRAHVLEWLRQRDADAASVENAWGGSSREEIVQGVYAEVFSVDVTYATTGGRTRIMNVCAGDMASLWRWVVGGLAA